MGKKFYAMMAVLAFAAGGMDVNAVYTLDGIEVSADRQKDRFGNMIVRRKGMSKPPVKLGVDKSYLIEKERTS